MIKIPSFLFHPLRALRCAICFAHANYIRKATGSLANHRKETEGKWFLSMLSSKFHPFLLHLQLSLTNGSRPALMQSNIELLIKAQQKRRKCSPRFTYQFHFHIDHCFLNLTDERRERERERKKRRKKREEKGN